MPTILQSKSIYYNDVNLIASKAQINSRSEVPKELDRIFVSPMSSVIGKTFALEANKLGLGLLLHRFCSEEEEAQLFYSIPDKRNVFCSIGLNDWKRVNILKEAGCKNWLIDIANGYIPSIEDTVNNLSKVQDIQIEKIMCGNIHTIEGFCNLSNILNINSKVKAYIRVGIAGGSPCATSDSTGVNRGQITEISECYNNRNAPCWYNIRPSSSRFAICADGGIKNGNYASKAFAAGADFLLMGGYFARAKEAETHVNGDGSYWGGASHKQSELYNKVKRKHSEGKVLEIEREEIKPLSVLVDELWGGLSSAVSYCGKKTLSDFIGNGVFEVKQNSLSPRR